VKKTALPPLDALIRAQKRVHAGNLRLAILSAVVVGATSTLLLGLSGWFIVASAVAGAAGLTATHAFNVLLPGAAIRLLAILRTASRYGERLAGHAAALRALAAIRPAVFAGLAAAPPAQSLALSRGEASARSCACPRPGARRRAWAPRCSSPASPAGGPASSLSWPPPPRSCPPAPWRAASRPRRAPPFRPGSAL
jgi:type IV secretory pathway TrbL component